MGLFRRSNHAGNSTKMGTEHPVFTLRIGMNQVAVRDLLGPPSRTTSMAQVLANYTVIGGRPASDEEAWMYNAVPSPELVTCVAFTGGVLDAVTVDNTREHRTLWSLP